MRCFRALRTLALASLASFLAVGCASVRVERDLPDGSHFQGRIVRFFWVTQEVSLKVTTPDGLLVDLTVIKSGSDNQGIQSISEGISKGIVSGLKP